MVQFSSKPPFNDDPAPYVVTFTKRTLFSNPMVAGGSEEFIREDNRTHEPRPEYNLPQHNTTNPILTEFRELHAQTGNDLWTDAYLSASDLIEEWDEHDREHWDHAMDVFTRILRMSK